MTLSKREPVAVTTVSRGVRMVRFTRPDVRPLLDEEAGDCSLFRQFRNGVLAGLEPGQTLVLNFGLIEQFPTAFYSWLLKVRELVLARKARLVLCRLSPEQLEIFELFQAKRLFDIARTEAEAVREAGDHSGVGDTW
jgi:anti-anti-sigma regulatory factor